MTKFLTELAKTTVVAGALNNWLRNPYPDLETYRFTLKDKIPDSAFHPSSAYECAREAYARLQGDLRRRPVDSTSQKSFLVGHFWHYLIQFALVEGLEYATWDDIEKEYEIHTDKWWAHGFADVAHCTTPSGDYLIDIKTQNSLQFRHPNLPFDLWMKYTYQVNLYMEWAGQKQCVLLMVEKDSPHSFKEHIINHDPVLLETMYRRWDVVSEAIKKGSPPKCDCQDLVRDVVRCPAKGLYE